MRSAPPYTQAQFDALPYHQRQEIRRLESMGDPYTRILIESIIRNPKGVRGGHGRGFQRSPEPMRYQRAMEALETKRKPSPRLQKRSGAQVQQDLRAPIRAYLAERKKETAMANNIQANLLPRQIRRHYHLKGQVDQIDSMIAHSDEGVQTVEVIVGGEQDIWQWSEVDTFTDNRRDRQSSRNWVLADTVPSEGEE